MPWIFSTIVEHFRVTFPSFSSALSQALIGATSNNRETTIKIILDTGRALGLEKNYPKRLKEASLNGIKAIRLLEKPGIDGKAKTKGNALVRAAQQDDSATVLRLLKNGADINYNSFYMGDALQAAAEKGKLLMVNLLLGNGADVNS